MATKTTLRTSLDAKSPKDGPTRLRAECGDVPREIINIELSHAIRDPKHDEEKPYDMRFDPGGGFPLANYSHTFCPARVRNFRPFENPRNFEEYGFASTKIAYSMKAAEFEDDKKVESLFYPAVERVLKQKFPSATTVKILEHSIRKRRPQFSPEHGAIVEFIQPTTLVHIDFTPYSAGRTSRAAFKIEPDQYSRVLTVNLWKSLQGPGNDWPLALCDWRTVDYESGAIATDVVFHNKFTENAMVYQSPRHEWYYFKDLSDDEIIIFRQTDTNFEGGAGGVPHTGFYNPSANKDANPRISIELRAFIFFK